MIENTAQLRTKYIPCPPTTEVFFIIMSNSEETTSKDNY